MMGDKRMIVIGGAIYKQTQERPYGLMNVVHDCGLEVFGIPYLEEQERRPLQERHPALQWMYTYVDHRHRLAQQGNVDSRVHQIGAGGAWFRFGYDLFTIRDNAKLQARLKERLLNVQDFQAARHELAVAAICIAAGFELDFEHEDDNSRKHTEFIGTDKLTGAKIAIEAKSRHRRGVKGFSGGRDIPPGQGVGIRGLVLDGFTKNSPLPSYIFGSSGFRVGPLGTSGDQLGRFAAFITSLPRMRPPRKASIGIGAACRESTAARMAGRPCEWLISTHTKV